MKKTTVLLGKGWLACRAADWLLSTENFTLAAIVPVTPEPTWTESLSNWGHKHEVNVVESGDYRDLGDVGPIDLAISVFYDKIIGMNFISSCQRIVNLHNGPLPKYRGVSPINWALKNQEATHGVTLHDLTHEIDQGPIVGQVHFPIYPEFDEVIDVYERALLYGRVLLETTLPLLDEIQPTPQDEESATYYSRKQDADLGERRGWRKMEER